MYPVLSMNKVALHKDIYNSLTKPEYSTSTNISLKNSFLIFILSLASILLSNIYINDYKLNIVIILFMLFSFIGIATITALLKISIIATVASLALTYKNDKNIKTFISNIFGASAIFILLLPIAFISNMITPIKNVIFILSFLVLVMYYIRLFYITILNTFNSGRKYNGVILLLIPIFYSFLYLSFFALFITSMFFGILSNL